MLLACALGVLPGLTSGATSAASDTTIFNPGNSAFWTSMIGMLKDVDDVLNPEVVAPPEESTEAGAIDQAEAVETNFDTGGVRPALSADEVTQGLSNIADLRAMILSNPELCLDAYWDSFLVTLDEMEAALRGSGTARGRA